MIAEGKSPSKFQDNALMMLESFRLMDDEFFSETLDGKIDAVQFIINTVLERNDLKIINTKTQREYKSATKRSIKLDIWAQDSEGRIVDIEIQKADQGTGAERARLHSSMIDRELLEKGQKFDELVETYVIFITENDKYDAGLPLYHIDRTIRELGHQEFGDRSHIVYVNGTFKDINHPIGRLMHDFWCTKADDMMNDVLAREVRYMKENEEGRTSMSKLLEEMLEKSKEAGKAEGKAEGKLITVYEFVKDGIITMSEGAKRVNLSEHDFQSGMNAYFS